MPELIKGLGTAATSPYAFVSYVVLIAAWVYVTVKDRRLRLIRKTLRDLPEKHRIEILQKEYNTTPRAGLSANQWLRSRRMSLFFLGYVTLLVCIVVIVVVYLWKPGSSENDIPPLKNPRDLGSRAVGAQAPLTTAIPATTVWADEPAEQAQPGSDTALRIDRVLQGESPDDANLLFDVHLKNESSRNISPQNFLIGWRYSPGALSSIAEGRVLKPIAKYILELPINTRSLAFSSRSQPVYPVIVVPAATPEGAGTAVVRLQLHYGFQGGTTWHPNADWDIWFSLLLSYEGGQATIFPGGEGRCSDEWAKDHAQAFGASDAVGARCWQSWRGLSYPG